MSKIPSPSTFSLYLAAIALMLGSSAFGQRIPVQIQWTNDATAELSTSFEGAYTTGDELPQYRILHELNGQSSITAVTLGQQEYEDLDLPDGIHYEVPSSLEYSYSVKQVRGKELLEVYITPFTISASGQAQRLLSATIQYQSTPKSALRVTDDFADNSKLASGQWYKLSLTKDGVYKIDRSMLQSMGINVGSINPNDINVYGNDQGLLPLDNSEFRYDDLQAKAIEVVGGDDGSFDNGDYILFYAKGPDRWTYNQSQEQFEHVKHLFADRAFVYVGVGIEPAVRLTTTELPTGPSSATVTTFNDYSFYEVDEDNIIESGRQLVGEGFALDNQRTFSGSAFTFPNIDREAEVRVQVRGAANSSMFGTNFSFEVDGATESFSIPTAGLYSLLKFNEDEVNFLPSSDNLATTVTFNPSSPDAEGWLDFIRINCRRKLIKTSEQMIFRDQESVASGDVVQFSIEDMDSSQRIWDITTSVLPTEIPYDLVGSQATFKASASIRREYVQFNTSNLLTPALVGAVENQNLHGEETPDMIIISAVPLLSVAEKFADMHRAEGLSVYVTTPQPIYEEFSCGMQDVTAIKMFARMFYERAEGDINHMVDYLMLLGDGTYLNNRIDPATSIYLPTHQSYESGDLVNTYVSDDYFGFLDEDEEEGISEEVDIGIGRIPAKTLAEAEGVFQKLRHYSSANTGIVNGHCATEEGSVFGDWRTDILLVADDEDSNSHMSQADNLSDLIKVVNNDYDIEKVFLDAYRQETTPGGARYPDAQRDVAEGIESGKYIVSYTGHGGEVGWSQERIIDVPTIQGFTNRDRLPILLTATCEFSRFDDPGRTSAGELMLLNPNGGAVALMTTTRLVFSGPNFNLSRNFYHTALQDGQTNYSCLQDTANFDLPHGLRLGDIIRLTKNCTGNSVNTLNFSLLGDPAIFPARAKENAVTTSDEDIRAIVSDSLQSVAAIGALQRVTISGRIETESGQLLSDFNGIVEPKVFDKKRSVTTLSNDGLPPFNFETQENIIYKGKASVKDGLFEYTFIVPKDIGYQAGNGRISYYALSDDGDAKGHVEGFAIGAGAGEYEIADDTQGPDIEVFLDSESFVEGGLTTNSPLLIAKFFDEHGINTVGNGIGHDITATIDGNTNNTIVLNDNYEAALDSFQLGSVQYQLGDLAPGKHELTLKVWDIYNNSSTKSIDFVVSDTEDLQLDHVINYPNPFTTYTEFMFEHNQSCAFLDVDVQIFTVSGKLVKTIQRTIDPGAGRSDPISWNGRDDFGDRIGRGVYVYKLEVTTPDGKKEEQFEKLVILN